MKKISDWLFMNGLKVGLGLIVIAIALKAATLLVKFAIWALTTDAGEVFSAIGIGVLVGLAAWAIGRYIINEVTS